MPRIPLPIVRMAGVVLGRVVLDPAVPIRVQRAVTDVTGKLCPAPAGVRHSGGMLGGRAVTTWSAGDQGPVILHLHGGCLLLGSPRSHAPFGANLAAACKGTVHLLDYRLAPEHQFPAAHEDAFAAASELVERHGPDRFVISGDSAGGGLTLSAAAALRDARLPQPRRLVMMSPWALLDLDAPQRRWDRDRVVTERMLRNAARLYLAGQQAPTLPDLRGLAPMIIYADRSEGLVTDAVHIAAAAQLAGVPVDLRMTDGLLHAIHFFAGLVTQADRLVAQLGNELAALSPPQPRPNRTHVPPRRGHPPDRTDSAHAAT